MSGVLSLHPRLHALARWGHASVGRDDALDEVAVLAAELCDAEFAGVTFVDEERNLIKGAAGLPADLVCVPHEQGLCHEVVARGTYLEIPDLAADGRFADRSVASELGLRSYAGAPVVDREGFALGAVWVAGTSPRRLASRERATLERLARFVAAGLAVPDPHRRIVAIQNEVLRHVSAGGRLEESLELLVHRLEAELPATRCSVLLVDTDGTTLRDGAAPSLPAPYRQAIDGIPIGEGIGSCGTAAFRRQSVLAEDIASDPAWQDYAEVALAAGLRACWSVPIIVAGECVGTFAVYADRPRSPQPDELALVEEFVELAAVAIGHDLLSETSRSHLSATVELSAAAGDWMWRREVWPEPRYAWVNEAMVDGSGCSLESFLADPDLGLRHVHPDDRAILSVKRDDPDAMWPRDLRWVRPDGEVRWLAVRQIPIQDRRGRVTSVHGVAMDITDRKRTEEALLAALDQERQVSDRLRELEETKNAILNAVSHQVRTPLTLIRGGSETLASHPDLEPETRALLTDRLVANARQLEQELDGLLDLHSLLHRSSSLELAPDDVAVVVREAVRATAAGVPVDVASEPLIAPIDRVSIQQAISCVIEHARRRAGADAALRVRCFRSGAHVVVTIEDHGPPMLTTVREGLFEPFGTVDVHDPDPRGSIGLPLVAEVARLHGGNVSAADRPGGGTVITITLSTGAPATGRTG